MRPSSNSARAALCAWLLALSACGSAPVMHPAVARAEVPTPIESGRLDGVRPMDQSCAGDLCFPYADGGR
jgi:hypothetical protein